MKYLPLFVLVICGFKLYSQAVNIPDPYFKELLISTDCVYQSHGEGLYSPLGDVDLNNNGEIEVWEADSVNYFFISDGDLNVKSFQGLEHFVNLERVSLKNFQVCDIDFNLFKNLQSIWLENMLCENIEIDNSLELTALSLRYCSLESASIRNCEKLFTVDVRFSEGIIDKIEFENNPQVRYLSLNNNAHVEEISLKNMRNARYVRINDNGLKEIEILDLPLVKELEAANNQIEMLDCSQFRIFELLDCSRNPRLLELNLKNNRDEEVFLEENMLLKSICIDDNSRERMKIEKLLEAENLNVDLHSQCTITNIAEQESTNIKVYPNPAVLTIQLDLDLESFKVYNILGQMVLQSSNYRSGNHVDISSLVEGVYYLSGKSSNQVIFNQSFEKR